MQDQTDHLRDSSTSQELKSPANISAERADIYDREYENRSANSQLPAEARRASRPMFSGMLVMSSSRSAKSRR